MKSMKELIKDYLYNNWLMTIFLSLLGAGVLLSILIGCCAVYIDRTVYPVEETYTFYTSEDEMYFIRYNEGGFELFDKEGEKLYFSDCVEEVFPGDTVIFKNENGTTTMVDLETSKVTITK